MCTHVYICTCVVPCGVVYVTLAPRISLPRKAPRRARGRPGYKAVCCFCVSTTDSHVQERWELACCFQCVCNYSTLVGWCYECRCQLVSCAMYCATMCLHVMCVLVHVLSWHTVHFACTYAMCISCVTLRAKNTERMILRKIMHNFQC